MKRAICGVLIAMACGVGIFVQAEPVSATSAETTIDTRTKVAAISNEDADLDTRTFTVAWSEAVHLNTKKIVL